MYQFIFFNNKQLLTDIIQGKLPSHAAICIRISYDRSTRRRASATSWDSCVGYLPNPKKIDRHGARIAPQGSATLARCGGRKSAFRAIGMRMELRGKQHLQRLGANSPKRAAGGCVPKNAAPRKRSAESRRFQVSIANVHYRAIVVALALVLSGAGCAVRYDATGVSRVGVGLWGFGDPPGVNWNLDWPRRDVPELPSTPRPELPRSVAPRWHERDVGPSPPHPDTSERREFPIEDNRDCESRYLREITCPMAVRAHARDRPRVPARS
ncbi:MAG: hypothetical protein ABWY07_07230 [Burkholderiales bacterium]